MARSITNYDVFISSPSDVDQERDIVQEAIDQLNQVRGKKEGFQLTALRWERDVSSQIGDRPQEIINKQIGNKYDIFIGILCSRFGQKTKEYKSGTEEEFSIAYTRCIEDENKPEILFYFKDPRKSNHPIDAEQLIMVQEFKKKVGDLGIYEEFDSSDSFKTKVLAGVSKALDRLQAKSHETDHTSTALEKENNPVTENKIIKISEFDEDVGILDLNEMIYTSVEAFKGNVDRISSSTATLGDRIHTRTEEIKDLKPSGNARRDQKAVKIIIEKVASEMQKYCHILDQSTPNAKQDFAFTLRCMEHAVIISHHDGLSNQEENKELASQLESLIYSVKDTHNRISKFRNSISALPRMTSKLNQAKRRTVNSIDDFLKFLCDAETNINDTLKSITG